MLTARENILLPLEIAGRDVDQAWFAELIDKVGLGDRLSHRPSEMSGGSSSASPSPGRSRAGRRSSSPTSRPATWTRRPSAEILELLRSAVDGFGQTTVMVTHDPHAAASPTASCSWPTAPSSATCRVRRAHGHPDDGGAAGGMSGSP